MIRGWSCLRRRCCAGSLPTKPELTIRTVLQSETPSDSIQPGNGAIGPVGHDLALLVEQIRLPDVGALDAVAECVCARHASATAHDAPEHSRNHCRSEVLKP